jgi:hypothetical protein
MSDGPRLNITRHYEALTEKETDEVVGLVADLIVAYLRKEAGRAASIPDERPGRSTPNRKEVVP